MRFRSTKKNIHTRVKFNWDKLVDQPEVQQQFATSISNRFDALPPHTSDVQTQYDEIVSTLEETAQEVLGNPSRRKEKSWVSQNTIKLVEQRNRAKKKYHQKKTSHSKARWKALSKEVQESYKKDEETYLNSQIDRLEEATFSISMGRFEIEKTDTYKYLGILFDNKLNWHAQIDKMCSKLSSVCGVISKVRHYLDKKSLLLIYNSLFDSRLRYGILGWGTASEQYISKLRVLQNRAVRFITFASYRSRMLPCYVELGVLPIDEIFLMQKSLFMHNLHYKNLPHMLSTYCLPARHSITTRYITELNYVIPVVRTNRGQSSIKFSGPKAWINIPKSLKEIVFKKPFSKKLKEHLLCLLKVRNRNLPKQPYEKTNPKKYDVQELFDWSYGDDFNFSGFETRSLDTIFLSDDDSFVFGGFESKNQLLKINQEFASDSEALSIEYI